MAGTVTTLESTEANPENRATSQRPAALRRRLAMMVVALLAAVGALFATAASSSATTFTTGAQGYLSGGGDNASRVVSGWLYAVQMPNYPNGQSVRARVAYRDLSSTTWNYTNFTAPRWVDGIDNFCNIDGCDSYTATYRAIGSYSFPGLAGHHYVVAANFQYLVGNSWSNTVWIGPETGTYTNTYHVGGAVYVLQNTFALT